MQQFSKSSRMTQKNESKRQNIETFMFVACAKECDAKWKTRQCRADSTTTQQWKPTPSPHSEVNHQSKLFLLKHHWTVGKFFNYFNAFRCWEFVFDLTNEIKYIILVVLFLWMPLWFSFKSLVFFFPHFIYVLCLFNSSEYNF